MTGRTIADVEMALANVSERVRALEADHTRSPDVRKLERRVAELEEELRRVRGWMNIPPKGSVP